MASAVRKRVRNVSVEHSSKSNCWSCAQKQKCPPVNHRRAFSVICPCIQVQGVLCKLKVATLIDTFCPLYPAHVLSCGRGVEALFLAILDRHHAFSKACYALLL
jgi:hypothetical protein